MHGQCQGEVERLRAWACVLAQMATLEKAEGLLEELRGASYDAAVREMDEVKAFATENVRAIPFVSLSLSPCLHNARPLL